MIYSDWLPFLFSAMCGFFGGMAWVLGGIDHAKQTQREFERMASKLRVNSIYGKLASDPIDRINTTAFYTDHNKHINKPEPQMNTARHQFNSITEARSFYSRMRVNRKIRHSYAACADAIGARLNQLGRFAIGTEFTQ